MDLVDRAQIIEGERIPDARRAAVPGAQWCTECANREEKRRWITSGGA